MSETHNFTKDGKTYTFREREAGEKVISECASSIDIPDSLAPVIDILEDLSERKGFSSDLVLVAIDGKTLDVPIEEASNCNVPMASNHQGPSGGRSA